MTPMEEKEGLGCGLGPAEQHRHVDTQGHHVHFCRLCGMRLCRGLQWPCVTSNQNLFLTQLSFSFTPIILLVGSKSC